MHATYAAFNRSRYIRVNLEICDKNISRLHKNIVRSLNCLYSLTEVSFLFFFFISVAWYSILWRHSLKCLLEVGTYLLCLSEHDRWNARMIFEIKARMTYFWLIFKRFFSCDSVYSAGAYYARKDANAASTPCASGTRVTRSSFLKHWPTRSPRD